MERASLICSLCSYLTTFTKLHIFFTVLFFLLKNKKLGIPLRIPSYFFNRLINNYSPAEAVLSLFLLILNIKKLNDAIAITIPHGKPTLSGSFKPSGAIMM